MPSGRGARREAPIGSVDAWFSPEDIYLFREGRHARLYEKLGAHPLRVAADTGVHFAVWAPNARSVSVIGDFNGWRKEAHPLKVRDDGSGLWAGFIAGIGPGALYKYHIVARDSGYEVEKADPFAFRCELPPRTASVVCDGSYAWQDAAWMAQRGERIALTAPVSIYEVHAGSWRRVPEQGGRWLSYRELALALPPYVADMGFTHVEFMPLTEHPFYGSWGYQTTGYFAPTARYGAPEDLMHLVDALHRQGIGVILDWVPSHFPTDRHGLGFFDGTHLFEHADPRRGYHPEWRSSVFNYGRHEVRSILISSALYWLDRFHMDGLRVDGVASMLYRDYARAPGEWMPNIEGGREDEEAIQFVRELNKSIYRHYPDVQTIAEESTAWPQVSRPVYAGGLGFGYKWNMGWMHDTLDYMEKDPIYRKHHQGQLTFSLWYAFSENFVLPLSHDEVVYGKRSLIAKMPGDDWQRFANLRVLLAYMFCHPGKKLLFMGAEIAQWREWNHEDSLDWHLLDYEPHRGIQRLVRDLNALYRGNPALHRADTEPSGFRWVDAGDWEQSVISFYRFAEPGGDPLLVVANFTPMPRHNYRLGVMRPGFWQEVLNTDATVYGGSGQGNIGGLATVPVAAHGALQSLNLVVPPLAVLVFKAPPDASS
ncbi:1,4-alpha-glucan branching protein GlgB [Acidiferrobacter sp.]|uniref:1,4-alpha-glucan branching protein GlgB n=1 Tax=Acidiferrobacter sp. TaxID=1872107 RepID=UPI0026209977|nr:1,4-alpha-glucan branching protein GlgB [Acidiferrobacter sp.]